MLLSGSREGQSGRRRRLGIVVPSIVLGAGALVVACSTPPPPSVAAVEPTPPPPRVEVPGWPDVTWTDSGFLDTPTGFGSERAVAVAGSDLGFVAAGMAERPGLERGSLWFSPDGLSWRRVAEELALDGVSFVDVAATDGAFVAVGTFLGDRFLGIPTRTVVLRSDDGDTWVRLPDDPTAPEAYAGAVAASPTGFLMTIFTLDADGVVLRTSPDGLTWLTLPTDHYGDAANGLSAPTWAGDGWIAAGVRFGSPVVLRSPAGLEWSATRLEAPDADGDIATDVYAGAWGMLAVGIASSGCGPDGSCAGRRVAWWSSDGSTWGRITEGEAPIEQGLVVSDGDRGVISVSGLDAWSSKDGWRWESLGQPAMDELQVNDAVVHGTQVVAVGDTYRDDATSYATFLLAGPQLVVTE